MRLRPYLCAALVRASLRARPDVGGVTQPPFPRSPAAAAWPLGSTTTSSLRLQPRSSLDASRTARGSKPIRTTALVRRERLGGPSRVSVGGSVRIGVVKGVERALRLRRDHDRHVELG